MFLTRILAGLGIGGVVVVTVVGVGEGAGGGRPAQLELLSASGPMEENWTNPGWSELMWELIQDW